MEPSSSVILCIVPSCKNNSENSPGKCFLAVPLKPEVRSKWFLAMRKSYTDDDLISEYPIYCCEDHFDIKEDTENYYYVTLMKQNLKNLKYKQDIVPHVFQCQKDWKIANKLAREKQNQEMVSQAIKEYEKRQKEEQEVRKAVISQPKGQRKESQLKKREMQPSIFTPHQVLFSPTSSTTNLKPPGFTIKHLEREKNTESVKNSNSQLDLMNCSKENSQQIPISNSPPPLIWNTKALASVKNSLNFINNINSQTLPSVTVHETPKIKVNKETNTLKRKEISTNTLHISDNEIVDILSKRIKIVNYSQYYDSSDSEVYKTKRYSKDKNWEVCESEDSDISMSDTEIEREIFKKQCLEITRKNHKKSWEKYFGLPSDCYWVIDSLANELYVSKCMDIRHMSQRDNVELVLRKLHLNENIYILGDYFGIDGRQVKKILCKYSKCISDSLHSIGIHTY